MTFFRSTSIELLALFGLLNAVAVCAADEKLPLEDNQCLTCHGNADLWEGETAHLLVTPEKFAGDVHWQKAVHCQDCHGGNPETLNLREAHAIEDGFRNFKTPPDIKALCGRCHEKSLATYSASVHGQGLEKSGLLVSAVCTNCHGSHGIYKADNPQSTLHSTNVAHTCAQCHRFIEERLAKSVHGLGSGPGGPSEKAAPGGTIKRKPSCTDCHQGHDILNPQSVTSRMELPDRCGNCHNDLSERYGFSLHGELTHLGYRQAASCSDCHGSHDIVPVNDPNSRVSARNRYDTCAKCHPSATANFADFDPHADHRDAEKDPVLHAVYVTLMAFLLGTFGAFGLHSLLWFVRELLHVVEHGRHHASPGAVAYVRFSPFHRYAHALLFVSFLGLALTGLPLKYSDSAWAKGLADALGGFRSTSALHRLFGLVNIGCLLVYVVRMLRWLVVRRRDGAERRGGMFGPDSPVPSLRDFKDFGKMIRWFFGLGPRPKFERWTYWEKFDFWGAFADIVIIGLTGLILWFPEQFCSFLPGETLNIAKVIHSTQALLATGFVFAIHFFSTHLRPEKFPMDPVMFTGVVSEAELREERPEYYERLRSEGRLEAMQATMPPARKYWSVYLGGMAALVIGLLLLLGILLAVFGP